MRITGPTSFFALGQRQPLGAGEIQAKGASSQSVHSSSSRAATHIVVELSKIAARARDVGSPIDVEALPAGQAREHFAQISALRRLSDQFDRIGIVAAFGSETTTSVSTLLDWLQKRAGIDQTLVGVDGDRTGSSLDLSSMEDGDSQDREGLVEQPNAKHLLANDSSPTPPGRAPEIVAEDLSAIAARVREISRPEDVSSLAPEAAKARLTQLRTLEKYGGTSGMGANATFNGQTTSSLETYMGWLAERGKTAKAENTVIPSPIYDVRV